MPRFAAPADAGGVLADPPEADWPGLVRRNRDRLNSLPKPLADIRAAGFVAAVATGHQPELFHPGVWAKNFAAARLAKKLNASAVNLVVDSDTLKSNALTIPHYRGGDPASVTSVAVPFDDPGPETAFADRRVRNIEMFRSFPDRVAAYAKDWPFLPMLPTAWGDVLAADGNTIGETFSFARRARERRWGVDLPDLFVTALARSEGFQRFAQIILADLPRFAACYNAAVRAYRHRNKLKSTTHPVPDLRPGEAPFWGPGRTRATQFSDPATLTPRALTLTLFARLFACDVFLHGIGGGKYDEVTDDLMRTFFGVDPPGLIVLTRTERLPFPPFPGPAVRAATRRLRDLAWNPGGPAEFAALRELLRDAPSGTAARRRRFREIRSLKAAWRENRTVARSVAEADLTAAHEIAAANGVLRRRDYSWVLFPEPQLREMV